ncbi:MAG: hypothetical protein AB2693_32315 [Candidatus Thiodiazotropha sp.]
MWPRILVTPGSLEHFVSFFPRAVQYPPPLYRAWKEIMEADAGDTDFIRQDANAPLSVKVHHSLLSVHVWDNIKAVIIMEPIREGFYR